MLQNTELVQWGFKAVNGTAPVYVQTLVEPHAPAPAFHSTSSAGHLGPPSLRANKALKSWLFSVLVPQWWNEFPTNVRTAESLSSLSKIKSSIPENYSSCNTVNNAKSSLLRTVGLLKPDSSLDAKWGIKSYIDLRDYHLSDGRCNSTSDITLN